MKIQRKNFPNRLSSYGVHREASVDTFLHPKFNIIFSQKIHAVKLKGLERQRDIIIVIIIILP